MTEAELTPEERKRLYNLVGLVFIVVLVIFLVLIFHFKASAQGLTGWDFFIWYGIPYSIIGPISCFLSYEAFYPKRVRKSRVFHVKRFARRTLSMFAVMLSLFAATSSSEVYFSETLGINAFLPGMIAFVAVFFSAVFLWLRRQNSRVESGL
jgi:hypothetical protein